MKKPAHLPTCSTCLHLKMNTRGNPYCCIFLAKKEPSHTCGAHSERDARRSA